MMILETIGENAGIVWRLLNGAEVPLAIPELKQRAGLSENDLYAAIGWLAREGKVFFTEKDGSTRIGLHPVNVFF